MNDNSNEGKLARIEDRLDRPVANAIAIRRGGSVEFRSMSRGFPGYKIDVSVAGRPLRSIPGPAGATHGRNLQAVAWDMEPFAVAKKGYVVNDNLAMKVTTDPCRH